MAQYKLEMFSKYIQYAKKALPNLENNKQIEEIVMYLASQFLKEIEQGLEGEIDYEEWPFSKLVDKMYDDHEVKGCYFCDRRIDGNEIPFDPDTTPICLTCQLKVANFMKAFRINPRVLFPHMGERKIQPVIYDPMHEEDMKRAEGESIH